MSALTLVYNVDIFIDRSNHRVIVCFEYLSIIRISYEICPNLFVFYYREIVK